MQEESVPDWISSDRSQGEGQGNPGVHLAMLSVALSPLRQRPVTLCHKRGGDLSVR